MRNTQLYYRVDHADCCVKLGLEMIVAIDLVKEFYPNADLAMRIGKPDNHNFLSCKQYKS